MVGAVSRACRTSADPGDHARALWQISSRGMQPARQAVRTAQSALLSHFLEAVEHRLPVGAGVFGFFCAAAVVLGQL